MMPPLMTVGSSPPASSSAATIEVVVVLPCVPPMAIADFGRISSASISARRTTGRPRARASTSSGLSRLIAEETTTTSASPRFFGVVADRDLDAAFAQPLHIVAVGDVGAAHADSSGWPAPRRSRSCRSRRSRRNGSDRCRAAISSESLQGPRQGGVRKALKRRPLLRNLLDEIGKPLGRVHPALVARSAPPRRPARRGPPKARRAGGQARSASAPAPARPKRRRPRQARGRSPPGRDRAHADRERGSPDGRSPQARRRSKRRRGR